MSSVPRDRLNAYLAFCLPLFAVLLLLLALIGLLGTLHGESFFGAIYGFYGTQAALIVLILAAAFGVVRFFVGATRRLKFYAQLGPGPRPDDEKSLSWLSWLIVAALWLYPPIWWMRLGIWRRKRQLANNAPDRPPVTAI